LEWILPGEERVIALAAGSAMVSPAVAVLTQGVLIVMLKCVAVLACGGLALVGLHLHGHGCPGARLLALAGLDVCATTAPAEDKKDDKAKSALSGTWMMKGGEIKIVFADKDVMKIYPHGNKEEVLAIVCDYTVQKDGLVKAKVSDLQGEAKDKLADKVPVGMEFTFTWKVKDGTAQLDEVKGENTDVFKSHLEGDYEKK
jgi:hypothetical protein